ncbi:integrase catalytic domain-containing protein [Trichonephila clavipes]|nr:integrase catalytic domain-containing protein [Trichonephila clavipes]
MFNLVCKPDEALASYMASEGIDWKFLPPRAPNFGGLWEAGVKSFKFYLKRVVGRSITSIVEPDLTNLNENRLDNWQKITKIIQLIWKRWNVDYLNSLQQRNKWHFEKKNAKIGDMVIIKEDNLPSCQWSLGRINNIYPGNDSKVRVVEVKTTRAVALSILQATVRFGPIPPQFWSRTPGGSQRPPTSLPLPPTSREDLLLDGYLEYPPCREGTIHLRTSIPSLGIKPKPTENKQPRILKVFWDTEQQRLLSHSYIKFAPSGLQCDIKSFQLKGYRTRKIHEVMATYESISTASNTVVNVSMLGFTIADSFSEATPCNRMLNLQQCDEDDLWSCLLSMDPLIWFGDKGVEARRFTFSRRIVALALYYICDRGSRVVKVSDRGWPCHEFEPSTTKDLPCGFVEWAQNEIAVVPDFHKRILFSDEAHFWLNGYVNKENCRIWSEANPQVYVETLLHPEKLTVWCALWAGGILLQKR